MDKTYEKPVAEVIVFSLKELISNSNFFINSIDDSGDVGVSGGEGVEDGW